MTRPKTDRSATGCWCARVRSSPRPGMPPPGPAGLTCRAGPRPHAPGGRRLGWPPSSPPWPGTAPPPGRDPRADQSEGRLSAPLPPAPSKAPANRRNAAPDRAPQPPIAHRRRVRPPTTRPFAPRPPYPALSAASSLACPWCAPADGIRCSPRRTASRATARRAAPRWCSTRTPVATRVPPYGKAPHKGTHSFAFGVRTLKDLESPVVIIAARSPEFIEYLGLRA